MRRLIRVAESFRAVFYAPYYAAIALGFYQREGIDVELISSATPGDPAMGLLNGTIDVIWAGPMRVMRALDIDANSPLMCFCEMVARDPFYLVGRSRHSKFQLTDLPSHRFAAVSEVPTPWMCLQHDLREQGVDPAQVVRAADRSMVENLEALRKGQLDVIQVFEPYVSMTLGEGIGDVLYAASTRGPTVYTTFIATRDGVARHRDAFAAMTRAIGQMQAWLVDHSAEELAGSVAPFFPHLPNHMLLSALQRYHQAGIWARAPEMSRQGFSRLADSFLSGGLVARLPRHEDCVEPTLG